MSPSSCPRACHVESTLRVGNGKQQQFRVPTTSYIYRIQAEAALEALQKAFIPVRCCLAHGLANPSQAALCKCMPHGDESRCERGHQQLQARAVLEAMQKACIRAQLLPCRATKSRRLDDTMSGNCADKCAAKNGQLMAAAAPEADDPDHDAQKQPCGSHLISTTPFHQALETATARARQDGMGRMQVGAGDVTYRLTCDPMEDKHDGCVGGDIVGCLALPPVHRNLASIRCLDKLPHPARIDGSTA